MREAGAPVSTNLFVRYLDLPVTPYDARPLEVVADGLLLFGRGAQLAIDTTLVSPVRADRGPEVNAPVRTGQALQMPTV